MRTAERPRPDAASRALAVLPLRRWMTSLNAALAGLVVGLFGPWMTISYFHARTASGGVLELPGGVAYAMLVAAFVVAAVCGDPGRPGHRRLLLAFGVGLAGYTSFWLGGAVLMATGAGFGFRHLPFGVGVLLGFAGSLLAVWTVTSSDQTRITTTRRSRGDLFLPELAVGGPGVGRSPETLMDRLLALAGAGHEAVSIVIVRLHGLDDIRRRFGSATVERIAAAMTHRVRAHLRSGDTVASLIPGEIFILLSGDRSDTIAEIVADRLRTTLARPIPAVERRQLNELAVTIDVARGLLSDHRFSVATDAGCLLDVPVPTAGDRGIR